MINTKKLRAFCRVLKGNRLWTKRKAGWLRTQVEGEEGRGQTVYCPLTYAYHVQTGEIIPVSEFAFAAEFLGFKPKEAEQIANAADEPYEETKLRRILERACRVRKEAA